MDKKILCGLDGSEGSFKALTDAINLARLYKADLHTLTVEELPGQNELIGESLEEQELLEGKYNEMIKKAKQIAFRERIEIKNHLIMGHEVKSFIEFIKQHGYDLLVIGFMGHSALYDRVMGSTCQTLVRMATCSVLVVK
jgi:nucleotide-binding universal stress UspA family protein